MRKNEFDEAATYFENSLAINESFKDSIIKLYNIIAHNALRINDPERALFLYQEIAQLVPEYEQANNLFLVGNMNFEKGNYPAALEAYTKALEIDSASPAARKITPKLIKALKECDSLRLALELASAEYEKLMGYVGLGHSGADMLNMTHGLIIVLVILGNISYFGQRLLKKEVET